MIFFVILENIFIFANEIDGTELMKLFILILAGLLTTSSVKADGIDRNAALKKAQMFLPDRQFVESKRIARAKGMHAGETDAFYVFNAENDRGFVIVSGDDRTRDILGYAETGNLDIDCLPDNLKWWLESYAAQISCLSKASKPVSSPAAIGPAIKPLIQTKWGQDWPFNKMCPDGNYVDYDESGINNYNHCVTGCVATAVSQVMYYWKWPKSCPSIDAYEVEEGKMLKALPETTFKWDDMTDSYSFESACEAEDAVAELMRYCGQALHLHYAPGVTGGSADLSVLVKTFGYSKKVRALKRDDYTTSQWEQIVYEELAERRPIVYNGASNLAAHQFVIDGYDGQGLFHINWGWRGLPDSYFVLALADPGSDQGIGGSVGAYHSDQTALFNLQPAEEGEVMLPLMRSIGRHMFPPQMNNTYTREDATADFSDVSLSASVYTIYPMEPESEMTAELGWALYQNDELRLLVGSALTTVPAEKESIVSNEMTVSFGAGIPEGNYVLCQVFRMPGETEWKRCEGYGINCVWVEVTPTTLSMKVPDKYHSSFAVNSMSISDYPEAGSPISVFASITNNGETQQLTATLWMQKQGDDTWTKCSNATCYIDLGATTDISLVFQQEEAGMYDLKLTVGNSEEAIETMTVMIAGYEDVVIEGIKYRCTPEYGRAQVIRDFGADTSVESPTIQQTVTSNGVDCKVVAIGNSAFYGWGMTSLIIPEGIETIGADAFRYCDRLTKIVLPSTLTSIGTYAFYGSPNLLSVISHIQEPPAIGKEMFMYQLSDYIYNSLSYFPTAATLYVPIGCKSAYEAQPDWSQFDVIEEGELVESVVDGIRYAYATGGTTATVVRDDSYQELTEVTIPATVVINGKTLQVTAIGNSAFESCGNLLKITLPEGLERIGNNAFTMAGLSNIALPSSLKTIGKGAFWNCQIQTMVVPEGVTTIGESAFVNMYNLVKLELPKSLKKIGLRLIMGCGNLTTVISHITNPYAISNLTFVDTEKYEADSWVHTPSPATLYVPKGELTAYQALAGWTCFAEIKEMEENTRIEHISNVVSHDAVHYDLTGKTISPTAKGLHVVKLGNNKSVKVMY